MRAGRRRTFSFVDISDGTTDLMSGSLFQEESDSAGVGGISDVGFVTLGQEHEDFGVGKELEDLSSRFESIE